MINMLKMLNLHPLERVEHLPPLCVGADELPSKEIKSAKKAKDSTEKEMAHLPDSATDTTGRVNSCAQNSRIGSEPWHSIRQLFHGHTKTKSHRNNFVPMLWWKFFNDYLDRRRQVIIDQSNLKVFEEF